MSAIGRRDRLPPCDCGPDDSICDWCGGDRGNNPWIRAESLLRWLEHDEQEPDGCPVIHDTRVAIEVLRWVLNR